MNKHTYGKPLKNVDSNSKSTVKIKNLPNKKCPTLWYLQISAFCFHGLCVNLSFHKLCKLILNYC